MLWTTCTHSHFTIRRKVFKVIMKKKRLFPFKAKAAIRKLAKKGNKNINKSLPF